MRRAFDDRSPELTETGEAACTEQEAPPRLQCHVGGGGIFSEKSHKLVRMVQKACMVHILSGPLSASWSWTRDQKMFHCAEGGCGKRLAVTAWPLPLTHPHHLPVSYTEFVPFHPQLATAEPQSETENNQQGRC